MLGSLNRRICSMRSSTVQQHTLAAGRRVQGCVSRCLAPPVLCSTSSGGNSKPAAARRKIKHGKNAGTVNNLPSSITTAAATVAAATVTTVRVEEQEALSSPPGRDITLVNPPLGFSNNIVPARPLVVTQPHPQDGVTELVDSSDEDLDDSSAGRSSGSVTPGGGTGRSSAWRCLILDSRYLPVNVVNWGRAVVMDLSGKVDVLEYHPGGFAYSAYKQHPLPAVLRVRTFVDVHEFAGRLSLTRKNLFLRDHHRCQYCGSSRDLTLDHVTPVCRGGGNSWQNLVTACMPCNQKKGDKSLQQLGWKLPCTPVEPTPQQLGVLAGISKSDLEHPPAPWVPYLATFKAALEKAQRRAAGGSASSGNGSSSSTPMEAFVSEQHQLLSSSPAKKGAAVAKAAAVSSVGSKPGNGKKVSSPKRMR